MSYSTIKEILVYIQYIQENKKYIHIGIRKYKENFYAQINKINHILNFNILWTNLDEIEKKLEEIANKEFTEYKDVVNTIFVLCENLSSVVVEESNPILPKLNQEFEEEER